MGLLVMGGCAGNSSSDGTSGDSVDELHSCSPSVSGVVTSVPAGGGTFTATASVSGKCGYTVKSSDTWLTFPSPGSSVYLVGSHSVVYTVAPTNSAVSRTATLTIGSQSFSVVQAGDTKYCTYSFTQVGGFSWEGGTVHSTVNTQAPCPWHLNVTSGYPGTDLPLDISQTSGVGPTDISITASEWDYPDERTRFVFLKEDTCALPLPGSILSLSHDLCPWFGSGVDVLVFGQIGPMPQAKFDPTLGSTITRSAQTVFKIVATSPANFPLVAVTFNDIPMTATGNPNEYEIVVDTTSWASDRWVFIKIVDDHGNHLSGPVEYFFN
jgi:hypothetical protein